MVGFLTSLGFYFAFFYFLFVSVFHLRQLTWQLSTGSRLLHGKWWPSFSSIWWSGSSKVKLARHDVILLTVPVDIIFQFMFGGERVFGTLLIFMTKRCLSWTVWWWWCQLSSPLYKFKAKLQVYSVFGFSIWNFEFNSGIWLNYFWVTYLPRNGPPPTVWLLTTYGIFTAPVILVFLEKPYTYWQEKYNFLWICSTCGYQALRLLVHG